MAARGPQTGRRGLERGLPQGFGRSRQLSLNKYLDPSPPSMRKGGDGEKKEKNKRKKREKNVVFSGCFESDKNSVKLKVDVLKKY